MIRYSILFCLLLGITLGSCDREITNARLKRIDSLGSHVNHVSEVVSKVDSSLMVNRLGEMTHMGDWLLDNLSDSLTPREGIIVGDYLRCQRYYQKAMTRYKKVKGELKYTSKQLETLRRDVKNSFYSDEEFEGYFRTEAEAVKSLVEATDELEGSYDVVNDRYLKTKPPATHVVDSIKSVILSSEPLS